MPAFPIRKWGEGVGYSDLSWKSLYLFVDRVNINTWRRFAGDRGSWISLNGPATMSQAVRRLDPQGDFCFCKDRKEHRLFRP